MTLEYRWSRRQRVCRDGFVFQRRPALIPPPQYSAAPRQSPANPPFIRWHSWQLTITPELMAHSSRAFGAPGCRHRKRALYGSTAAVYHAPPGHPH